MKRLIVYMAGILLLAGCSTTKHLPEGEILYTGQKKMIVENRSTTPVGETPWKRLKRRLPLLRTILCWVVTLFAYLFLWGYGFTMAL